MNEVESFSFRGMKINNFSYADAVARICRQVGKPGYVCFVEATSAVVANRDVDLMSALNGSTLSLPDGMSLVWYGRSLGSHRIERIPGPEIFRDFVEHYSEYRHFLLGDTPERLARVIQKAVAKNRNLRISGYSPPFRKELTADDNSFILERISQERPDIIWVALGLAKQAKWMHLMSPKIERGVVMGVGAAFKFYVGDIPTPPRLLQKFALQWMTRVVDSPGGFVISTIPNRARFLCYLPVEWIHARLTRRGLHQWTDRS